MAHPQGDRASRRRKSIILAKGQRKIARIRETLARELAAKEARDNPPLMSGPTVSAFAPFLDHSDSTEGSQL